jgi:hypothetical protein
MFITFKLEVKHNETYIQIDDWILFGNKLPSKTLLLILGYTQLVISSLIIVYWFVISSKLKIQSEWRNKIDTYRAF